ncbi:CDP-alcohol phosphatidyltransferase family protein [Gammaproteobacteria bacterium]|nr:CDP-alcohol phosphatidyltransferase family protein [Gammaproteobacteria bacterium]
MNYFIQFLTYFRIILAPIIFLTITVLNFYGLALILFLLASASDYWDGLLARRYDLESEIGAILDPVADKILITFVIIGLCIELSSPFIGFFGGLILVREFWVGALRDLNARNKNSDATKVSSMAKIKTTIQFITFCSFLAGLYLNNMLLIFLSNFLLFLAFLITCQTGIMYTQASFKK